MTEVRQSGLPDKSGPWCNIDGTRHFIRVCDDRGAEIASDVDALVQVAKDTDAVAEGMALHVTGPDLYHLCDWEGEPNAGIELCECDDPPDGHEIECWTVHAGEDEVTARARERRRIARWLRTDAEVPVPFDIASEAGSGFHPVCEAMSKALADAVEGGEHVRF